MLMPRARVKFNICTNNDIDEREYWYVHSLMKINVVILVNRVSDCLLGNTTDLISLSQTWATMRVIGE